MSFLICFLQKSLQRYKNFFIYASARVFFYKFFLNYLRMSFFLSNFAPDFAVMWPNNKKSTIK